MHLLLHGVIRRVTEATVKPQLHLLLHRVFKRVTETLNALGKASNGIAEAQMLLTTVLYYIVIFGKITKALQPLAMPSLKESHKFIGRSHKILKRSMNAWLPPRTTIFERVIEVHWWNHRSLGEAWEAFSYITHRFRSSWVVQCVS